jgi:hypothetical protein
MPRSLRQCQKDMLTMLQEAWDSYIQNSNPIDQSLQLYPTMDVTQSSPDSSDPPTYSNSVFMGANTPGR